METYKEDCPKKWNILGIILFCLLACLPMKVEGRQNRSMYYVCPPDFIRLGNSCYFLSATMATWQDALFACKDRESNLTSPERWEDRNLREYLNRPEIEKRERWIGGLYDWEAKSWKWGGEMKTMQYQSFSRMQHKPGQDLRWHCVAMIPDLHYRWAPKSCVEGKHYICQTKIRKVRQSDRNKLRQRWNPNGTGNRNNEIPVPDVIDYEAYNRHLDNQLNPLDPKVKIHKGKKKGQRKDKNNNASSEPSPNIDQIPESLQNPEIIGRTAYAHRQGDKRNGTRTHKKKPFRGFVRNKEDPEAAYIHNINALRSGKSGLSVVQVNKHLRRLERLRKKEERAKLRKERLHDQQNRNRNTKADRNLPDSALAPKISNIRSRNLINAGASSLESKRSKKLNKGKQFLFENVTQKTYVMNNQLSALHPKTIVEVHEFTN